MKYVIGVDLGGTQLRAVLIDRDGRMYRHERTRTAARSGPITVIGQIEQLIERLANGLDRTDIIGVGVGTPGPLDPADGIVRKAPNLAGWVDVPLKAELIARTGLPVVVGNDANAAALGEWRFGVGRGTHHFIYVTISTGIGGGVIVGGQLLLGQRGLAGEVGHMTIQVDGPLCGCGNRGCWEVLASGTALARAASAAVLEEPSAISDLAGAEPIGGRHIAAAAEQDDPLAQRLMAREGELIGMGIVNLLHLYAPERIALGGGVINSWSLLEPHARRVVAEHAMPAYRDTPVSVATLGQQVGVIGAAALML